MAFTAREVIMTFRGQNYLSGALRRVGRDVGSLSRASTISMQRAQASIVAQRARNTLRIAQAEQLSVTQGVRRQNLDIARMRLTEAESNHLQQIRRNNEAITLNAKNQLDSQTKMEQLLRAQASGRPIGRGLRRMDQRQITRAVEAEKLAQDRLVEQQITLERQAEILAQKTATQSAAVQELVAREAALGEREAQLTQIINTRTAAVERAELQERRLAYIDEQIVPIQGWQERARAVEHFGRVLQMVGLIATAALGATAQASSNLQTQVTLAATQARPPGAPVAATANIARQVQNQTLGLMRQLPFSGQDFADAFYQVFSGTNIQNVKDATSLIQNFGRAAVAGGTDLKTMVDVGITLHNVFPKEFKNSTQAANAFFAAVRYGRMNAEQFASSLGNVVPIAQRVGLSFNDIAGAMAALTRQTGGRLTNRDATGIARMIEVFARPEFVAGAKKMGINVKDAAGNMRPLLDIIRQFAQFAQAHHTGGIDALNFFKQVSALGSATGTGGTQGTIQARRAFSFLINDINNYRNVSKLVRQDNDEMVKSFEAMSKTPGVRWELFKNQLKVLAYTIGTQVIPAFITLSRPILRLVDYFLKLSPHTQKFIAMLLTIISVGALVGGTLASIAGGIGVIVAQFVLWRRMKILDEMLQLSVGASRSGGALSSLAGEAGSVSVAMAGKLGIAALIPLMIIFHHQTGQVINALGGLRSVLGIVTALASVFTLARAVSNISKLIIEARAAGVAVSGLKLGLAALNGFVAVATLMYVIKVRGGSISDPLNLPHDFKTKVDNALIDAQNAVTKYSGAHAIGSFLGFPGGFGKYTPHEKTISEMVQEDLNRVKGASGQASKHAAAMENVRRNIRRKAIEDTRQVHKNIDDQANNIVHRNVRTVDQWIQAIEKARSAMLGDPKDLQKAKNYERLVDLMNKRFKDQPALLAAINDVLGSYDSNLKKATNDQQKAAQSMQTSFESVLQGIQQRYQTFLQQEQGIFGTLFQGPFVNSPQMQNNLQFGGKVTGPDLVKDLRSQIRQFTQFHGSLNRLARRGAPEELINQLAALGPQAKDQIAALSKLSGPELKKYFGMFKSAQQLVHRQTMNDLRRQLKDYRKYGRGIALQIIAGLRDENMNLTRQLTRFIKQAFGKIPTQAQLDAQNQVTPKVPKQPRQTRTTQQTQRRTQRSTGSRTTNHNYTHTTTIIGEPTERQKAQARHDDFRRSSRYRRIHMEPSR